MYYVSETNWQKELIKDIAKQLKVDVRVVREIAYYPIVYLKDRISDEINETPVRIRHLGVFNLMPSRGKEAPHEKRFNYLLENSATLWDQCTDHFNDKFESEECYLEYITSRNIKLKRGYLRKLYNKIVMPT